MLQDHANFQPGDIFRDKKTLTDYVLETVAVAAGGYYLIKKIDLFTDEVIEEKIGSEVLFNDQNLILLKNNGRRSVTQILNSMRAKIHNVTLGDKAVEEAIRGSNNKILMDLLYLTDEFGPNTLPEGIVRLARNIVMGFDSVAPPKNVIREIIRRTTSGGSSITEEYKEYLVEAIANSFDLEKRKLGNQLFGTRQLTEAAEFIGFTTSLDLNKVENLGLIDLYKRNLSNIIKESSEFSAEERRLFEGLTQYFGGFGSIEDQLASTFETIVAHSLSKGQKPGVQVLSPEFRRLIREDAKLFAQTLKAKPELFPSTPIGKLIRAAMVPAAPETTQNVATHKIFDTLRRILDLQANGSGNYPYLRRSRPRSIFAPTTLDQSQYRTRIDIERLFENKHLRTPGAEGDLPLISMDLKTFLEEFMYNSESVTLEGKTYKGLHQELISRVKILSELETKDLHTSHSIILNVNEFKELRDSIKSGNDISPLLEQSQRNIRNLDPKVSRLVTAGHYSLEEAYYANRSRLVVLPTSSVQEINTTIGAAAAHSIDERAKSLIESRLDASQKIGVKISYLASEKEKQLHKAFLEQPLTKEQLALRLNGVGLSQTLTDENGMQYILRENEKGQVIREYSTTRRNLRSTLLGFFQDSSKEQRNSLNVSVSDGSRSYYVRLRDLKQQLAVVDPENILRATSEMSVIPVHNWTLQHYNQELPVIVDKLAEARTELVRLSKSRQKVEVKMLSVSEGTTLDSQLELVHRLLKGETVSYIDMETKQVGNQGIWKTTQIGVHQGTVSSNDLTSIVNVGTKNRTLNKTTLADNIIKTFDHFDQTGGIIASQTFYDFNQLKQEIDMLLKNPGSLEEGQVQRLREILNNFQSYRARWLDLTVYHSLRTGESVGRLNQNYLSMKYLGRRELHRAAQDNIDAHALVIQGHGDVLGNLAEVLEERGKRTYTALQLGEQGFAFLDRGTMSPTYGKILRFNKTYKDLAGNQVAELVEMVKGESENSLVEGQKHFITLQGDQGISYLTTKILNSGIPFDLQNSKEVESVFRAQEMLLRDKSNRNIRRFLNTTSLSPPTSDPNIGIITETLGPEGMIALRARREAIDKVENVKRVMNNLKAKTGYTGNLTAEHDAFLMDEAIKQVLAGDKGLQEFRKVLRAGAPKEGESSIIFNYFEREIASNIRELINNQRRNVSSLEDQFADSYIGRSLNDVIKRAWEHSLREGFEATEEVSPHAPLIYIERLKDWAEQQSGFRQVKNFQYAVPMGIEGVHGANTSIRFNFNDSSDLTSSLISGAESTDNYAAKLLMEFRRLETSEVVDDNNIIVRTLTEALGKGPATQELLKLHSELSTIEGVELNATDLYRWKTGVRALANRDPRDAREVNIVNRALKGIDEVIAPEVLVDAFETRIEKLSKLQEAEQELLGTDQISNLRTILENVQEVLKVDKTKSRDRLGVGAILQEAHLNISNALKDEGKSEEEVLNFFRNAYANKGYDTDWEKLIEATNVAGSEAHQAVKRVFEEAHVEAGRSSDFFAQARQLARLDAERELKDGLIESKNFANRVIELTRTYTDVLKAEHEGLTEALTDISRNYRIQDSVDHVAAAAQAMVEASMIGSQGNTDAQSMKFLHQAVTSGRTTAARVNTMLTSPTMKLAGALAVGMAAWSPKSDNFSQGERSKREGEASHMSRNAELPGGRSSSTEIWFGDPSPFRLDITFEGYIDKEEQKDLLLRTAFNSVNMHMDTKINITEVEDNRRKESLRHRARSLVKNKI